MIDSKDLEKELQEALEECASLMQENERLKKLLGLFPEDRAPTTKPIVSESSRAYTSANQVTNDSAPLERDQGCLSTFPPWALHSTNLNKGACGARRLATWQSLPNR